LEGKEEKSEQFKRNYPEVTKERKSDGRIVFS
jgi:hypothetical protein